jgi:hypothetical protein
MNQLLSLKMVSTNKGEICVAKKLVKKDEKQLKFVEEQEPEIPVRDHLRYTNRNMRMKSARAYS